MDQRQFDVDMMRRAIELARRGEGFVEPNPMVGAVVARDGKIVGEGWHAVYGEAHAEVEAIRAAGEQAAGADLYVTLEPCCHHGKTPPCTDAIRQAGVRRVVAARQDPFPLVDGGGLALLREAGITTEVGLLADEATALNAPFFKLIEQNCPWIIAKWAMTLDGKIATHAGESRWISGESSRAIAHRLRGRVDSILIGSQTARRDDPSLLADPPGARVADRIVLDSKASLPVESKLARTAHDSTVIVVAGPDAPSENCQRLSEAGCEIFMCESRDRRGRLNEILEELAGRRVTNLLVEGGGELLGSLFDDGRIDEVHVFIAPKLIGGSSAPAPIAGRGVAAMGDVGSLENVQIEQSGDDVYVRGRVVRGGIDPTG